MRMALLAALLLVSMRSGAQQIRAVKVDALKVEIEQSTKPIVVNFWASWCVPCIEEMPHFQEALAGNSTVDFVFVSLDQKKAYPAKLDSLITRKEWKGKFYWLDETDADYFCPMIEKNWDGNIPATLFVNGKYRRFLGEQLSREALRAQLKKLSSAK